MVEMSLTTAPRGQQGLEKEMEKVIINREELIISIEDNGNIKVINKGSEVKLANTVITPVEKMNVSETDKKIAALLKKAGRTHFFGGKVGLNAGENEIIKSAIESHPANIAKAGKSAKTNEELKEYYAHHDAVTRGWKVQ